MKTLKASNLSFSYTEYPFLQKINLSIDESDGCIFLVGRNGAGKTTLLNVLNGLLQYKGKLENTMKTVLLSFESPLLTNLSVEENLKYYYRCFHKRNFSYEDEQVKKILQALSIHYVKQKVSNCSSGEHKKVALACLLFSDADLMILDEPFVALDYQSVDELMALINEWKHKKVFLITSHSLIQKESFVDRLLCLNEGTLQIDTKNQKEINDYFLRMQNETITNE